MWGKEGGEESKEMGILILYSVGVPIFNTQMCPLDIEEELQGSLSVSV